MDEILFCLKCQLFNVANCFVVEYMAEVERTRLSDEQIQAADEFSRTAAPEAQGLVEVQIRHPVI